MAVVGIGSVKFKGKNFGRETGVTLTVALLTNYCHLRSEERNAPLTFKQPPGTFHLLCAELLQAHTSTPPWPFLELWSAWPFNN